MNDATQLRELLARARLSVRAAARALGLSRDKLRQYTEGRTPVPAWLWLAAERLADGAPNKEQAK